MRQLPSHRVGRDELVVQLAGHLLKQQIVDLKASNSEAQTRNTRAARRSRRRASLADLVGPQKTIPLSTRRTREYVRFLHSSILMSMRSIAATEAGCSISNVMLQQHQELLLRHLIAVLAGLGLRQNQRRRRATAPRSVRSPAAQAPARPASSALATPSAMTRPKGGRHPGCRPSLALFFYL